MGIISEDVRKQIAEMFKELTNNVTIIYHENEKAQLNLQIKNLLKEVVDINDKIKMEIVKDDSKLTPYFDLKGVNNGVIRFMGIPSGHEFTTLIESIKLASTGNHMLSDESVAFLKSIDKPVDMKVFITTTCPHCPSAVFLAHRFACVSDEITASMVEAMEFQELSMKFNITAVPNTIINDSEGYVGAYPENMAIDALKKKLQ